jgi:hypothetical protein
MKKVLVGLCALGTAAGSVCAQNVLVNPGFESGLAGWTTFGNVFAETITPRTGAGDAKMFGNFTGGFNVSGLFQTFPAAPGQNWAFDGYFRHNTGDLLVGTGIPAGGSGNWVISKMEFRDASNNVTGFVESMIFDGASTPDTWQARSINLTAPANTTSVWAFLLYLQPQFDGGAVLMDDMSLVPAPGALGLAGAAGLLLARRRRA